MDELKSINDTWGHSSGDLAIKTLANIGRLRFPDNAIFARMGGDEFLAVIPYCSKQNGANLVSRISAELADTWPDPKRHFNIKFSAGVYSTILSENDLLEDCLRAADRLMYKEKQAHRAARQKAESSRKYNRPARKQHFVYAQSTHTKSKPLTIMRCIMVSKIRIKPSEIS